MRLRIISSTCVLATLLVPQGATAAQVSPYVRVDLGHGLEGKLNLKPEQAGTQNVDLSSNLLSGLALGADFNNGIRLELEASNRKNDLNQFNGAIDHGNMVADTIMGNLYYDFLRESPIRPYVGVGAGALKLDVHTFHSSGAVNINAAKTVPAFQAMLGVSVPLTQNLGLDVGYRYLTTQEVEISGLNSLGQPISHSLDLSHSATRLGLTYRFGSAPRPPAPEVEDAQDNWQDSVSNVESEYTPPKGENVILLPVPPEAEDEVSLSDFETDTSLEKLAADLPTDAPTPLAEVKETVKKPDDRVFVVHFAFDSADLNLQSVTEIQTAATYAIEGKAKAVNVSGYTDKSGSMAYNLKLSKRRAVVVVNTLVEDGVDPALINYVYRGESDPVVATRDGVPEARNRRTQIDIQF